LVKERLVLVVSPLIALMQDQVNSLDKKGIPAGCLHSHQSDADKRQVFRSLERGGPFVLYVSPERTQKPGFQQWIRTAPLALIAIDEAHCVSQWGHDFREEYSQLKNLKEARPEVPMLALTASATPFVLRDIARQLGLISPARHVHGFYRPNLYYQVQACADEEEKLLTLNQALRQFPEGRIIIYCGTRKVTESLKETLSQTWSQVGHYHAGMSGQDRIQTQAAFARGDLRILVATNAFGMGIDQPDVRLVVHFQMPANIDSLYQEMGRAGRDGAPSTCLLLYAKRDRGLQAFFIQSSKAKDEVLNSRWRSLDNLVEYCEGGECRHAEILTYYQDAQRIERCGHCDVCDPHSLRRVFKPVVPAPKAAVKVRKKSNGRTTPEPLTLTPEESQLFEVLRAWRKEKSKELDVPAFVILGDRTLRHLSQNRPINKLELEKVYGLGANKIERFGSEILKLLNGDFA